MKLADKISTDLKNAMKAKDQNALRGIRAIKAALLLAQTDGTGQEMNEEKEISILQKLIKQRKDSLDIFTKQNREDLALIEKQEIDVISGYLPKQLSSEELNVYLNDLIDKVGATSMKDIGKIMGIATKELAGKSDGKTISGVIKSILG